MKYKNIHFEQIQFKKLCAYFVSKNYKLNLYSATIQARFRV